MTFSEISEDDKREREVIDVGYSRLVKFAINGDASNIKNWDIISAEYQ